VTNILGFELEITIVDARSDNYGLHYDDMMVKVFIDFCADEGFLLST